MTIKQFKNDLANLDQLNFILPDGVLVPAHFHITEVGLTTRNFIDCGGTVRKDMTISLQIWVAGDTDHRLHPAKLNKIIAKAEPLFAGENPEVEIEYQVALASARKEPSLNNTPHQTMGIFGLEFDGGSFLLTSRYTDCLAKDKCGIPSEKPRVKLGDLQKAVQVRCCTPESNCC